MLEHFKKYLESKFPMTAQDFEVICRYCITKKLRRKQYLLQAGNTWTYNVFVSKGFLKLYYLDNRDQERILQFAPENYWTSDREGMKTGKPSKFNIDAIEDSEVVLISNDDLELLRKLIPAFNDYVNESLSRNVIAMQERIHVSITFSAEEKYFNFIEQYPHFASRIPLHMIASYLGISAETLSRIRKNTAKS